MEKNSMKTRYVTKTEIKNILGKAIQERYNRFNALWLKATGHTFEEDSKWCKEQNKKELKVWNKQIKPVLKAHGFKTIEEYNEQVTWKSDSEGSYGVYNTVDEIEKLLKEKPNHTSLFPYEQYCISEARKCAEFVLSKKSVEWWQKKLEEDYTIFGIEKVLKEECFSFDEGHSGNSFYMSIRMADCLIRTPQNFKYMHGAMAYLVGDKGYHDDRSDVPKK